MKEDTFGSCIINFSTISTDQTCRGVITELNSSRYIYRFNYSPATPCVNKQYSYFRYSTGSADCNRGS